MDLIPSGPSTLLGGHRRPYSGIRAVCPIDRLRRRLFCATMISERRIYVRFAPPWTIPRWAWPSAQVHQDILPRQESGLGFTPPLRFSDSRVTKGVVFLLFFSYFFVGDTAAIAIPQERNLSIHNEKEQRGKPGGNSVQGTWEGRRGQYGTLWVPREIFCVPEINSKHPKKA